MFLPIPFLYNKVTDMTGPYFILASSSPRRIELLGAQGYRFKVVKPLADEHCTIKDPVKNALDVSLRKAKVVAVKNPSKIILSADTIVVLDKLILGKPKNKKDALDMLSKLNNRTHKVITAFTVAVYKNSRLKILSSKAVTSKVIFGDFSKDDYINYIKTKEPMDKAGAYAVQGLGSKFIKTISGSYTNVVGLPLFEVSKELQKAGVPIP